MSVNKLLMMGHVKRKIIVIEQETSRLHPVLIIYPTTQFFELAYFHLPSLLGIRLRFFISFDIISLLFLNYDLPLQTFFSHQLRLLSHIHPNIIYEMYKIVHHNVRFFHVAHLLRPAMTRNLQSDATTNIADP